jgi:phosphoglycolate phosphatase-like HAD superfamily hydrolase
MKMMNTPKMICFDMDGTIADLYAVKGWNEMLRAYDPTPYAVADPMWDMEALRMVLDRLMANGIEIRIITWLSMDSTEEYKDEVRNAKREWLEDMAFPYTHFHGVAYGATKADSIRKEMNWQECETAILFDDNAKVRKGWHMGEAYDPVESDICEVLREILGV